MAGELGSLCVHITSAAYQLAQDAHELLPFSLQISTMGSGRVKWLLQSEPPCCPLRGIVTTVTAAIFQIAVMSHLRYLVIGRLVCGCYKASHCVTHTRGMTRPKTAMCCAPDSSTDANKASATVCNILGDGRSANNQHHLLLLLFSLDSAMINMLSFQLTADQESRFRTPSHSQLPNY